MRVGFVVVGVILVLLGAVLMLVPLITSSSETLHSFPQYYEANVTGFSITGSIPGTLAWTSNGSITFFLGTCSVALTNDRCPGTNTTQNESGTSGTFNFNVPSGGVVFAGFYSASAATASIAVKLAQTTIAVLLLIVGVLLLIVGLVLRRKGPKMAAPTVAPPAPSSPPPSPPPA